MQIRYLNNCIKYFALKDEMLCKLTKRLAKFLENYRYFFTEPTQVQNIAFTFTTPYLMGGNHPKMLGIALFDQFNKYLAYNRAAALSVIMFLICAVSAGVYIYTNLKDKDWEK